MAIFTMQKISFWAIVARAVLVLNEYFKDAKLGNAEGTWGFALEEAFIALIEESFAIKYFPFFSSFVYAISEINDSILKAHILVNSKDCLNL